MNAGIECIETRLEKLKQDIEFYDQLKAKGIKCSRSKKMITKLYNKMMNQYNVTNQEQIKH